MSIDRRLASIEKMLGKLTDTQTTDERDAEASQLMHDLAPKVFTKCGHPFPSVQIMSGDGCFFEARYTCKICGEEELYP